MKNNQGILYNKSAAVFIMSLMIIFACLFGVWKPLHKMQAEVAALFWGNGEEGGISIQEDLKTKTGLASNLVVLAKKYKIDSGQLEGCIQNVNDGKTPFYKMSANMELNKAVAEVREVILKSADDLNMSEIDKKAFDSTCTRIDSQEDIIARSVNKYNEAAEHYNKELGSFPAGIFGKIVRLKYQDIL